MAQATSGQRWTGGVNRPARVYDGEVAVEGRRFGPDRRCRLSICKWEEKTMLAEFSIYPVGGTSHLSKDIAHVIQTLGERGLRFELGPLSTAIEGDWDEVLAAIRACHQKMLEAHDRVVTTITIDERLGGQHCLADMVDAVKRELAAQKHDAEVEC
jgi:uncharacterized protein (TIGR00106 family)